MSAKECMKCSRPALIHITDVVTNGPPLKVVEVHLCLEHAIEGGLMGAPILVGKTSSGKLIKQIPMHPELAKLKQLDAAAGITDSENIAEASTPCPTCGTTWVQFQKGGLLGCPNDYILFEEPLTDMIRSMHERHTQHTGKLPPQSGATDTVARARKIQLESQLSAAVQGERYEEAARLRDQLRAISESIT